MSLITNLFHFTAEVQAKPAPTEGGAATMSQQAAAPKKNEDSLSPFTSDAEDAKPRKWSPIEEKCLTAKISNIEANAASPTKPAAEWRKWPSQVDAILKEYLHGERFRSKRYALKLINMAHRLAAVEGIWPFSPVSSNPSDRSSLTVTARCSLLS